MNRSGRTIGSVLTSVALVASGLIFVAPPVSAGTFEENAAAAVVVALADNDCSGGMSGSIGNNSVNITNIGNSYSGYLGLTSIRVTKSSGNYWGYLGLTSIDVTKSSGSRYYSGRVGLSSVNIYTSSFDSGRLSGNVRLTNVNIRKNGNSYLGSLGLAGVNISCKRTFNGVSPSTPSIEPEVIETPAPAPEIPSPTTEVDTPTSSVGENVGLSASPNAAPLPAGAVQMESGLNAYVAYPDGGKPNDTCFINPSAPTSTTRESLDPVKYSVRRGQTLSWVQLSHISGVEYCADGKGYNVNGGVAKVAKYGKKCKKVGGLPQFLPPDAGALPADGAITVAGGVKAKKKGKCRIFFNSNRGYVAGLSGLIELRIR